MARSRTDAEPAVLETDKGFKYLPPTRQLAWFGFLQAHKELMHALDAELHERNRVSLSAYELLNRLAHAQDGWLRMSDLARQSPLSISRVSRVVDQLELAGWVQRASCASDSRVVHVTLTDGGRDQVRAAQDTFFAVVEERWFANLSCDEVRTLAEIFARMGGGAGCAKALGAEPDA